MWTRPHWLSIYALVSRKPEAFLTKSDRLIGFRGRAACAWERPPAAPLNIPFSRRIKTGSVENSVVWRVQCPDPETPFGACIDLREWKTSLLIVLKVVNISTTARRASDCFTAPATKTSRRTLIHGAIDSEFCRHCFDVTYLPISTAVVKKNA